MNVQDLTEMVADMRRIGDDLLSIEAKRASTHKLPKSCGDSLSAFANTGGGVLILGLDESDDFKASGVENAGKLMADLGTLCSTGIEPPLRPTISSQTFEGVEIVTCEVDELTPSEKPCFVVAQGQARGSYIRVHDGDQHLTQYEIQTLLANRGQPKDDVVPVTEASLGDLDPRQVSAYMEKLRKERPYAFADISDELLLVRSRIATELDGVMHPTVAGLLSLGQYPQQFFPQLNITFVHYPSPTGDNPTTGERFIDSSSLDGPIPTMIQEALRVVRRNMSRRSTVNGAGREDVWEYPETALREAIVNACIHRDLSPTAQGTQVQIEMFPDRLLIRNPGGLYGPVTEGKLGEEGISSSRNAALLRILEDVSLPDEARSVCENRGSGIRSMINALRAANMSLPIFKNKISSFEVNFPNHALLNAEMIEWIKALNHPDLSDTQCVALASMKHGIDLTNETYRTSTGIDSRLATTELQDLVGRGLVDQRGSRRWATYSIRPDTDDHGKASPTQEPAVRGDRRTAILDALGESEMSRAEIEEATGLARQVVSYWLRTLRKQGEVLVVGDAKLQSNKIRYRKSPGQEEIARGQQTFEFH